MIKDEIDRRGIFLLSWGERDKGIKGGSDGSGSSQSSSASLGGGGIEYEADFAIFGGRAKEAFSVASGGGCKVYGETQAEDT